MNLKKYTINLCEKPLKEKLQNNQPIEQLLYDKVYPIVWNQIANREEKEILRRNVNVEYNQEQGEYVLTFYYSLK